MSPPRRPLKLDADGLWDYALRALSQRPHSAAEIRQKLSRRAASPPLVAATLAKLQEYSLIDDQKFSQSFASARLENQGFGRARVFRDLRAKRIASQTAQDAVSSVFAETDETALIDQFLARRYRNTDLRLYLQDDKKLASVYRRLRTAGFGNSTSLAALKRFKNDLPEWEDPPDDQDPEN